MPQAFVPVAIGSGKKVATEEQVVGADTLEYQQVVLVPGQLPVGCSVYHVVAAASTNAANVKATPGQLYGWRIFNLSAAFYPIFVKLHNTAGTPTAGAGVVQTIAVQTGVAEKDFNPLGTAFSVGIGLSIVKGIADPDATPVAAGDCVVDLFFA